MAGTMTLIAPAIAAGRAGGSPINRQHSRRYPLPAAFAVLPCLRFPPRASIGIQALPSRQFGRCPSNLHPPTVRTARRPCPPYLARGPAVDFGKDGVEPSQAPESCPHRDLSHRQRRLVEKRGGSGGTRSARVTWRCLCAPTRWKAGRHGIG